MSIKGDNLRMMAMRKYRFAIERVLVRICEEGVRIEKDMINMPYPPASLPGEPPHRRTGNLRDNIGYEILRDANRDAIKARIGVGKQAWYLRELELGRPPDLLPRPSLRPLLMRLKKEVAPKLKVELLLRGDI